MKWSLLAVAMCVWGVSTATAQPVRPPSPPPVRVDVSKLPIDIRRIQRVIEAQQAAETARVDNPFRLEYYVQVYGKAPELELFRNFNPESGPVPFSAPTHRDILNLITPKEFRAGSYVSGINLEQLIDWLQKQLAKKRESRP